MTRIILASASIIRSTMLSAAGVAHGVDPARLDESAVKFGYRDDDAALALALAEAKALESSVRRAGNWVIGADSLASVGGRRFDKPASRAEAADHLRHFSGRTIELTSAVALARGGTVNWAHVDRAALDVRPLSERFIHTYLEAEWPVVGHCVGVFRMEGLGAQLFERVEGSHFAILGLPLLPLLGALRDRRAMPS